MSHENNDIRPSDRVTKKRLLLTEVSMDGLEIKSFDRSQCTKIQKRFKYNLTMPGESLTLNLPTTVNPKRIVLDAWVMDNNLSILMLPFPIANVIHIETKVDAFKFKPEILKGKSGKGKMKKGVRLIDTRDVLAEITCVDEQSTTNIFYHLVCPIQGRLLELNSRILHEFTLLRDRCFSEGYIAVLLSVVPDIIGRCGPGILTMESDVSISQLCFQWIRGSCPKGEMCKYFHPIAAGTASEDNKELNDQS